MVMIRYVYLGVWPIIISSKISGPKSEKKCVCKNQERSKRLQNLRSEGQKIYLEQGRHIWQDFNGEAYRLSTGGESDDRQDNAAGGVWC